MRYQAAFSTMDTFPPGTVRSWPCLKGHDPPLPARHECANCREWQSGVSRVLCHSQLNKANPGSSCRSRERRAHEGFFRNYGTNVTDRQDMLARIIGHCTLTISYLRM